MAASNSINASTSGIVGFTGSAFTGTPLTEHALLIGGSTSSTITNASVAATGTVLRGVTGADPDFTATPNVTSISFGAGSSLANYVASTAWTPVLAFGGASVGITYSTQNGVYARIGSIVFFVCNLTLSNKGSSMGNATIITLPVTPATTAQASIFYDNLTFVGSQIGGQINVSSAISLNVFASAIGTAPLTDANFANNSIIRISGCYMA